MKIEIEPTTRIVMIADGRGGQVPARVWEGHTGRGVPVIVLVTRIAVARDADASELEAELVEQRPPSHDGISAIPTRLVL